MAGTVILNAYSGLSQGPIDHDASSVINVIFDNPDENEFIIIGSTLFIKLPPPNELLPSVDFIFSVPQSLLFYGIAVGGVRKGIYPNLNTSTDVVFTRLGLTTVALEGEVLRLCTQGRCIAEVGVLTPTVPQIFIGDPLTPSASGSNLIKAESGDSVVARALQDTIPNTVAENLQYIAVDLQREGILP